MKKTKFTEQQIAFTLRQAETGTRVVEVCRKLGFARGPRQHPWPRLLPLTDNRRLLC